MRKYELGKTGVDHKYAGGEYEDAYIWSESGTRVMLAMADGMGSARLASDGSSVSVKSAEEQLHKNLLNDSEGMVASIVSSASVRTAMSTARNEVAALARSRGDDVGDYDTTLMVVSFNEKTGILDYGYVGDGGIIVAYEDRTLELLETPQKGSVGSSTYSLMTPSMWRFGRRDSVVAFLVATDGVLDALMGASCKDAEGAVAELLLDPPPDDSSLNCYFEATLECPMSSPVAGVVDDRSVFICWADVLINGESEVF